MDPGGQSPKQPQPGVGGGVGGETNRALAQNPGDWLL